VILEADGRELRIRHLEAQLRETRLQGGAAFLLAMGAVLIRDQSIGDLPARPLFIGVVVLAIAVLLWRQFALERAQRSDLQAQDARRQEAIEAELARFPHGESKIENVRAPN
jgi:hypothetical protein